jgi:hypothetical protein
MSNVVVTDLFRAVDLSGVFANAILGGVIARRTGLDPIGFLVLAVLSGLGGGLIRDTLLQHGTPVALTDYAYLLTAFAGAAPTMAGKPSHGRGHWFDRSIAACAYLGFAGTPSAAAGLCQIRATNEGGPCQHQLRQDRGLDRKARPMDITPQVSSAAGVHFADAERLLAAMPLVQRGADRDRDVQIAIAHATRSQRSRRSTLCAGSLGLEFVSDSEFPGGGVCPGVSVGRGVALQHLAAAPAE